MRYLAIFILFMYAGVASAQSPALLKFGVLDSTTYLGAAKAALLYDPILVAPNSIKGYLNQYKKFASFNTDSIVQGTTNLFSQWGMSNGYLSYTGSTNINGSLTTNAITATAAVVNNGLTVNGGSSLNGTTTVTDLNSIIAYIPTNFTSSMQYNAVGTNPIATQWHDLLAFNKVMPTLFETSADGTTFNTDVLDANIFAQKQINRTTVINCATQKAARWTFTNMAYSFATWLEISCPYNNPTPTKTILVEAYDGTSWSTISTSTNNDNAGTRFYFIPVPGNDNKVRVTITTASTSGLVQIQSMRIFSNRPGDQGYGKELESPFYWDKNKNIGIGIDPSSGTLGYNLDVNGTARVEGNLSLGANVGIGTTSPAAALDITSTTSGILIPRMTTIARNAIGSPATGLLIYNITTLAYNTYNGSTWLQIIDQLALNNLPVIVAAADVAVQTSAINAVSYTTSANSDSIYSITARVTLNSATASGVSTSLLYTDENGTNRTLQFYSAGSSIAAITSAGVTQYAPMTEIRAKGGTTINVVTNLTGNANVYYGIGATITRVRLNATVN